MKQYDHKKIEKKWQKEWEKKGLYKTNEDGEKKKCYVLDMFPYPSGEGLHVGHPKGYIASDIYARYKTMRGFSVLHPMGWDAFGLPAENYAIKNKVHPRIAVRNNIKRFKKQLEKIGFSYDWGREINTTDPAYYKWTQWIFLKLFEAGLAYQSDEPINWCPSCKTGLALEDLEDGKCERCGSAVELKPLRQWVLKIREYADKLLSGLDTLSWPESVKESQKHWIGRSEGYEIQFLLKDLGFSIPVFTTRPDTLFGATYLVLAPEHPFVEKLKTKISNIKEVEEYVVRVKDKTELERVGHNKEKTGVELKGVKAVNPANKEEIPIWVADYVLLQYGTGAIMAVPAHDERDFEFANKYGMKVIDVISKKYVLTGEGGERNDVETIYRKVVDPILRDNKENFYLIKEGENHIHFAGGGVGENEDDIEALRREIIEETGFTDFKIVRKIFPQIWCQGFRHTKNKNQRTVGSGYEVVLNSETRIPSEVEDGKHELIKVKKEDVLKTITWEHHRFLFEQYLNKAVVYSESGVLINSAQFDGMDSEKTKDAIMKFVGGVKKVSYKLRDWVFSRQRYWGEPIPLVFCETCKNNPNPKSKGEELNPGWFAVEEADLPLELPSVKQYEPTGTGESPLANIKKWVETKCPRCGGNARRETNTMPQWAGSSWYYLAYAMHQTLFSKSKNKGQWSKELEAEWLPVHMYVGGVEHATRHLIYARFWHKFLYDLGLVHSEEPFLHLKNQGLIAGEDGRKMSKRWGNVVNPDDVIATYGADTLRVYEMFMGPFEDSIAWKEESIIGSRRFLERVWRLQEKISEKNAEPVDSNVTYLLHKTIKKVGEDIEQFRFNTAVSGMMILLNEFEKLDKISAQWYSTFIQLIAPFSPYITEELWHMLGNKGSVHQSKWPEFEEGKIKQKTATIAVQVNGKVRDIFEVESDEDEKAILEHALARPGVKKWTEGKVVKKVVYIKGKLLSLVVS